MSEVDPCSLFIISGYNCLPHSFLYSSNLYEKQNLGYPWTCLPLCLLSLWSWSVDVFVSLPSRPQVALHLFLPFLPIHVARFWTLTRMFPKYWPNLCQPYLHCPQVPRHCQFWTLPSMPASVLTDQLHPALWDSASCTLCLLLFQIPLSSPTWKRSMCVKELYVCRAVQIWPCVLAKKAFQRMVVSSHPYKILMQAGFLRFLWEMFWTCYCVAGQFPFVMVAVPSISCLTVE